MLRVAGERLDVERLGVLAVDPVADAAQPGEVAQVLLVAGSAGHLRDRATSRWVGASFAVCGRLSTCCRCSGGMRAVAQFGSALDWGSSGRRFKSCQPDLENVL